MSANGNDPSWRPNEDAVTIRSEELWLQGAFVACVAYGAVAVLCVQCFFMLLRGFSKSKLFRDGPLILFVFLIFCINTLFIGVLIQFTQQSFIDDRNFPGGPAAYEIVESLIPINVAGNTALIVITMLADALLVRFKHPTYYCAVLTHGPAMAMHYHLQEQSYDPLAVYRSGNHLLAHRNQSVPVLRYVPVALISCPASSWHTPSR